MSQIEILEQKPFYMGSWLVSPAKNQIKNNLCCKTIQPKLIEVLTFLCSKQNKIISSDELIKQCWPNQFISDNPIHKCIAQLRKALGDSSKNPKYIATIPKRGYSVIAKVTKIQNQGQDIEPYWLDKAPFNGLKQYTSDQQEIFFGRNKPISDVLALIDQKQTGQTSLIMVLGQSGCGKSSLVLAGVLPKLIRPYKPFKNDYRESYLFIPLQESPSSSLIEFLYKHKILSHQFEEEKYQNYLTSGIDKLIDFIKPDVLTNRIMNNNSGLGQIVLFIDQLEYVFSQNQSKHEIEIFFTIISTLLDSKKCLIISALRNEYYQELTESHAYIKIRANAYHYDIPPLSYDEISDIVRKPIQAAGLMYETDPINHISLDSYLINKAQSKQVSLPILQYTLSELYKNREENLLSYLVYKSNGGMEGGLSKMAEKTFQDLPIASQEKFEELLHNLIQINPDARKTISCKKTAIKQFDNKDFKNIISTFTDKRLFQTEWINNESYLSITHDILISHWQRLRDWVSKNITLLNSQHEIKTATNNWLHHEKNKDFLLNSEQPIKSANDIKQNIYINLTKDEKAFIQASNSKFSFAKRLKIGLVGALVIFLALSTILAVSINYKNKQITTTKNNAENLISFILFDLKDKLTPLGRVDLLDLVGSKTIEYFASIDTENLSTNSLIHWVQASHIVGEVNFTKGDYQQSYLNFQKGDDILLKALSRNANNIELLEMQMLGNYWLGYLNFLKKDYQLSEKYWKNYLKVAKNLSTQQPDKQKWLLETSYAFNNLGTLSISVKKLNAANEYFNHSIAIKKQLLLKQPNNQVLIADLADSISWLGKIKEYEGDLKEKLKINHQSLVLSRKLNRLNPSNPQWLNRLSMALHRVALSYYIFGNLKQAKIHITESIKLMQSLVNNDKENFSIKRELINNYLLLAKIHRHQGNLDRGLYFIQKSQGLLDVFKTNLKFTQEIALYNIHIITEQAIIINRLNQNESALQTIDKAFNLWQDYFQPTEQNQNAESAQVELALIKLIKLIILQAMDSNNKNEQMELLHLANNKLVPLIEINPYNYRTIAIYLQILKISNNLGTDRRLENQLKLAKYLNPDFVSTASESSINLTQAVEISLSHE